MTLLAAQKREMGFGIWLGARAAVHASQALCQHFFRRITQPSAGASIDTTIARIAMDGMPITESLRGVTTNGYL
jgi:hypothetical protein